MKFAVISFVLINLFCFQAYSQPQYFIVIGVDGMGAFGLKRAHTPVMDSLVKAGSSSFKVKAVHPTLSNPNWASMLMGVKVREHKIKDNQWRRSHASEISFCQGKTGETYPTIFSCIRQQDSSRKLMVVHQWKEFAELVEKECLGVLENTENEMETVRKAYSHIGRNDSVFLFLHLDHVDKAGHKYGLKSKEYRKAIEKADSLIGTVVMEMRSKELLDKTVFLITADHGFRGKRHGGRSRREKFIPLIISGTGIKSGYTIRGKRRIYDIAPTVIEIMGLIPEQCWTGKTISEIIKK